MSTSVITADVEDERGGMLSIPNLQNSAVPIITYSPSGVIKMFNEEAKKLFAGVSVLNECRVETLLAGDFRAQSSGIGASIPSDAAGGHCCSSKDPVHLTTPHSAVSISAPPLA